MNKNFPEEKNKSVPEKGPEDIPRLSLLPEELLSDTGFQHLFSIRDTFPLHTHTFYEFFLVLKGKGIHYINNQSTLLSEGSFVLIRPSDCHGYGFLNQYDMEMINVTFPAMHFSRACMMLDCPESLFTEPELCLQLQLEEPILTELREKMLHFGDLEAGPKKRQYLLAVLPWLLYQFISNRALQGAGPLPAWLAGLVHRMEEPGNFIAGLPRLLSLAGLSQEYVNRSFRRYLRMSPTEFINMRRMELAASLLLENRMEIIDICQECGFHNLSHFYHIFRLQYGCSPGKFQERNRRKLL